jgi:hypothetical protein
MCIVTFQHTDFVYIITHLDLIILRERRGHIYLQRQRIILKNAIYLVIFFVSYVHIFLCAA